MDDNLYPTSGAYQLTEPEDQVKARNEEKSDVFQAYPVIKDVIARLDERIAFYASVDSIPEEATTDPAAFMHIVAANRIVRDNLVSEKTELERLIQAYVAPEL